MREDVRALLANDATMAALLTGGVWSEKEISRQNTPTAFDANGEIKPCALVKLETETAITPYPTGSRQYILVLFYQFSGYTTIDSAMARAYALLHRAKVGNGTWEIDHANDVLDQEDTALACSLAISRYVATRKR